MTKLARETTYTEIMLPKLLILLSLRDPEMGSCRVCVDLTYCSAFVSSQQIFKHGVYGWVIQIQYHDCLMVVII